MAQGKRKSAGGGKKKGRGWLLILVGLGIGVAGMYLTQLVIEHGLHRTVSGWFKRERTVEHDKSAKKEAEKPRTKFDFYTILPETETRLPDRGTKDPKPAKLEKEKPEEGISYVLQAGSFPTFEDADQLKAKLALQGLQAHIQRVTIEGKGDFHRVRLGPYNKIADLDAADQQLAKIGIRTIRLKIKKEAG